MYAVLCKNFWTEANFSYFRHKLGQSDTMILICVVPRSRLKISCRKNLERRKPVPVPYEKVR